jgi:prepilin-type N-terminal cleavage/methylation domain-containing protein
MKKKNGFTFIELLAVIVVLAILVLLAMPRVTTMMERARVNSFVVEANEIAKVAQTAYSDKVLDGDPNYNGNTVCFTVDQLIKDGYLDKEAGDVRGVIVLDMTTGQNTHDNQIKIYTYLSKKNYYIALKEGSNTGKIKGNNVVGFKGDAIYNSCTTTCDATANGASVTCKNGESTFDVRNAK